jgi:ABC-type glycerol-3-phosphate transport system permease component
MEMLDAARVDGANHLQTIWYIIMPLARAPVVTLALVNGLWVWNELLIALMFLQSESTTTIMAALARGTSRDVANIPLITAGAFAASIPVLILIGFGQRYFIRGFLGGSSK